MFALFSLAGRAPALQPLAFWGGGVSRILSGEGVPRTFRGEGVSPSIAPKGRALPLRRALCPPPRPQEHARPLEGGRPALHRAQKARTSSGGEGILPSQRAHKSAHALSRASLSVTRQYRLAPSGATEGTAPSLQTMPPH